MNYIPENTELLTDTQIQEKIAEYDKRGVTVVQGLTQDLQKSEDAQVKEILDFLELDTEQVFNKIQDIKTEYKSLKPEDSTVFQTENLSDKVKQKIVQEANALGIDHRQLIIKELNEKKYPGTTGETKMRIKMPSFVRNNQLVTGSISCPAYPKIRLASQILKTTLSHELHHVSRGDYITYRIVAGLYNNVSEKKVISKDDYKKLENNYVLSFENFAGQYAILRNILSDEQYSKNLFNKMLDNLSVASIRPDAYHISLFEQYIAAENITKLLQAEKQYDYKKSHINPRCIDTENNGLKDTNVLSKKMLPSYFNANTKKSGTSFNELIQWLKKGYS